MAFRRQGPGNDYQPNEAELDGLHIVESVQKNAASAKVDDQTGA